MPRLAQSAAANALLLNLRDELACAAAPSSKSHARGVVAAAMSRDGHVGVDVEYCAPGRDICAIATWLAGMDISDDESAYRLFTFREAYFKAFGKNPDRALLRDVACAPDPMMRPAHNLGVLFAPLENCFLLSLVWSGAGEPERLEL